MAIVMFGNLILHPSPATVQDRYTMINLYSFRRTLINEKEYRILNAIAIKKPGSPLTIEEQRLMSELFKTRQILTTETKQNYDTRRQQLLLERLNEISPLINNISITPSFACNFACTYCYQRSFKHKEQIMKKEDIDQIIQYIEFINGGKDYRESIKAVSFNGGEITLERNIEVIDYVLRKFEGNEREFYLLTNGSKLANFNKIIDLSLFSKIQISLDGEEIIIPSVNKVDGNIFDIIIESIHLASKASPIVEVACMITRDLINNFDIFFTRLKQEGILNLPNVIIKLAYISDFTKGEIDDRFLSIKELADFSKEFRRKEYDQFIIMNPLFETRHLIKALYSKDNKNLFFNEFSCGLIDRRTLMFTPDKSVHWCICADQSNEPIGHYDNPQNKDISKIRSLLHRNVHEMPDCKCCDYKYICTGGCPLYSLTQNNDLSGAYCGMLKNRAFIEQLEDYLW